MGKQKKNKAQQDQQTNKRLSEQFARRKKKNFNHRRGIAIALLSLHLIVL